MDRNLLAVGSLTTLGGSLSARRAWIEIRACILTISTCTVALRKESVDRNVKSSGGIFLLYVRRSPQGERG